jgi:hypothetical protein
MERVKKFFHRHRRGIAITAAVAAAGYLTYTFLRQKAKDLTEATSTERNDQEKYQSPNSMTSINILAYEDDLYKINRIPCLVY